MRVKLLAILLLMAGVALAQDQPAAQEQGKPQAVTPTVRLAAAKSVYLRSGGGSDMPFDAISSAFADWGRFAVVNDPAKADLIVEVTSPDDGRKKDKDSGGVGGFTANAQGKQIGGHASESSSTPESTRNDVLMVVRDAKTKAPLWQSTEKPGGEKGASKADKFVGAGVRLMERFKQRLEPTAAAPTS